MLGAKTKARRQRWSSTTSAISCCSAPKVIRLEPSGGVLEAKPKTRRERWSSTPSALSCYQALEVIHLEPDDGVPDAAASAMNSWGFHTISHAMQSGFLLNISPIFINDE